MFSTNRGLQRPKFGQTIDLSSYVLSICLKCDIFALSYYEMLSHPVGAKYIFNLFMQKIYSLRIVYFGLC